MATRKTTKPPKASKAALSATKLLLQGQPVPSQVLGQISAPELQAVVVVVRKILAARRLDGQDRMPSNPQLKAQNQAFARTVPAQPATTLNSTQVINQLPRAQRLAVLANEAQMIRQEQSAELAGNRPELARARGA